MNPRASSASRLVLAACLLWAASAARGQNLVPDPHFSSGISAWSLRLSAGIAATLVRDPGPGADGAPGFAALEMTLSGVSPGGTPSVDFDDVYLGRAGTVEPPVPVPVLSRAGDLALGVALALGGLLMHRAAR